MENVENLVSHDKGETLHRIVTTLEDELSYRIIGVTMDEDGSYAYSGKSFIRNSKNFGLPQNLPRVYIIAFSKKMYGDAVKVLSEDMPFSGRKVIAEYLNSIIEPIVDDVYYMAILGNPQETQGPRKSQRARVWLCRGKCLGD